MTRWAKDELEIERQLENPPNNLVLCNPVQDICSPPFPREEDNAHWDLAVRAVEV